VKPLEIIQRAAGTKFKTEDGDIEEFKLLPPLTLDELRELELQVPCPIPEEARELLLYCRGFEGVLESIDFSGGCGAGFGIEEIFPHALPIAHDGFGNYWIIDLINSSTTWGPIFFACHDAPVIVFQTHSLGHFISEVIRFGNPPWKSEIDDVHEKYQWRIWEENPGMMTYEEAAQTRDPDLMDFANSLGDNYLFIDLRDPNVGDGFSWGRYGPRTENKRFQDKRIFAYKITPSFVQRLSSKLREWL
jgi:hypothetical protein